MTGLLCLDFCHPATIPQRVAACIDLYTHSICFHANRFFPFTAVFTPLFVVMVTNPFLVCLTTLVLVLFRHCGCSKAQYTFTTSTEKLCYGSAGCEKDQEVRAPVMALNPSGPLAVRRFPRSTDAPPPPPHSHTHGTFY